MQIHKYSEQGEKVTRRRKRKQEHVHAQKHEETLPSRQPCRLGVRRKAKGQTWKTAKPTSRGLSVLHSEVCISSTLSLPEGRAHGRLKAGSDISRRSFLKHGLWERWETLMEDTQGPRKSQPVLSIQNQSDTFSQFPDGLHCNAAKKMWNHLLEEAMIAIMMTYELLNCLSLRSKTFPHSACRTSARNAT